MKLKSGVDSLGKFWKKFYEKLNSYSHLWKGSDKDVVKIEDIIKINENVKKDR